jgi:hypothetical protein
MREVCQRWVSSVKPRSPRHLIEYSSAFLVRLSISRSSAPLGFSTEFRCFDDTSSGSVPTWAARVQARLACGDSS